MKFPHHGWQELANWQSVVSTLWWGLFSDFNTSSDQLAFMNLAKQISTYGIDTNNLKSALLEFKGRIDIPSHYDAPLEFIDSVTKIDIIEAFLKLLLEDGESELPQGSFKVRKLKSSSKSRES